MKNEEIIKQLDIIQYNNSEIRRVLEYLSENKIDEYKLYFSLGSLHATTCLIKDCVRHLIKELEGEKDKCPT